MLSAMARADVQVDITVPDRALQPRETFEVPVYVTDGDRKLASYAFRIYYSPDVVRITEIIGGLFEGFSEAPVTDSRTFESGVTDFTANNAGLRDTPEMLEVARVRFEIIGMPGVAGEIEVGITPLGGLVDGETFGLLTPVLPAPALVTIDSATAPNTPPVANAGPDISGFIGVAVSADGDGSFDPDDGPTPLQYAWRFGSLPVLSALDDAALLGANDKRVTFTPDVAGSYQLRLTVSDGLASVSDSLQVNVSPGAPDAPEGLRGRAKGTHVNLIWSAVDRANSYTVFRRLSNETAFTEAGTVTHTVFVDRLPSANMSADYYVIAENEFGQSQPSQTITVAGRSRGRGRAPR